MHHGWFNRRSRLAGKLFLLLWVGQSVAVAQTRLQYRDLPSLPALHGKPNPGVAGAFAGVSYGVLLVAGGANFPNGYPWQGGTKVWQSAVYALVRRGNAYDWQIVQPLSRPLAYGASVVWRNQLICVGGNDAKRRYADIFTLTWDPAAGRLRTDSLPALPVALANLAAAVAGDTLYAFGGESDRGTERTLYALSLLYPASGWLKRADLPGPARAYTALVAGLTGQEPYLYVLGGRQTVAGVTTVYADAYEYRIGKNQWHPLPPIPLPLSAHGAINGPDQTLLLIGGDDGSQLKRIEALNNQLATMEVGKEKGLLTAQRNALQKGHPGFSRRVWQYHIGERTWSLPATLPYPAPVTTPVVRWGTGFILPSGEIAPGVRTPTIRQIEPVPRR